MRKGDQYLIQPLQQIESKTMSKQSFNILDLYLHELESSDLAPDVDIQLIPLVISLRQMHHRGVDAQFVKAALLSGLFSISKFNKTYHPFLSKEFQQCESCDSTMSYSGKSFRKNAQLIAELEVSLLLCSMILQSLHSQLAQSSTTFETYRLLQKAHVFVANGPQIHQILSSNSSVDLSCLSNEFKQAWQLIESNPVTRVCDSRQ